MKKSKKRVLQGFIGFFLIIVLSLASYVAYLEISYYRIEDNLPLKINNPHTNEIDISSSYSISTYNIGFGAYEQSYSFFMDKGEMLDGTKTVGKYSRALSFDNAMKNTRGSLEAIKDINADFMMLQEVDTDATRSYKINQVKLISDELSDYSTTFASNFHMPYLPYPITSPHGYVNSGLLSLSKYKITDSKRISLPVSDSFIDKFFDLDRCLLVNRYLVGDKELVLINAHFSAYDEGGVYRQLQKDLLNKILAEESGNYVIVAGDFNHDIANSKELFPTSQKTPTWIYDLSDDDLTSGYRIEAATNVPTCRGADIPYIENNEKTLVHTVVIDGFIVSNNINVHQIKNIDLDFAYSDHQPAYMEFSFI